MSKIRTRVRTALDDLSAPPYEPTHLIAFLATIWFVFPVVTAAWVVFHGRGPHSFYADSTLQAWALKMLEDQATDALLFGGGASAIALLFSVDRQFKRRLGWTIAGTAAIVTPLAILWGVAGELSKAADPDMAVGPVHTGVDLLLAVGRNAANEVFAFGLILVWLVGWPLLVGLFAVEVAQRRPWRLLLSLSE